MQIYIKTKFILLLFPYLMIINKIANLIVKHGKIID